MASNRCVADKLPTCPTVSSRVTNVVHVNCFHNNTGGTEKKKACRFNRPFSLHSDNDVSPWCKYAWAIALQIVIVIHSMTVGEINDDCKLY